MTKQFHQATENNKLPPQKLSVSYPYLQGELHGSIRESSSRTHESIKVSQAAGVIKTTGAISGPETAIIYSQSAIVRHRLSGI